MNLKRCLNCHEEWSPDTPGFMDADRPAKRPLSSHDGVLEFAPCIACALQKDVRADRMLVMRADGTVSHVRMTRKAFYKLSRDYRNSPRKTDAPTVLQYDAKRGTCLVQVDFTCEHFTPVKTWCAQCSKDEHLAEETA
jgi:hypothetical protein